MWLWRNQIWKHLASRECCYLHGRTVLLRALMPSVSFRGTRSLQLPLKKSSEFSAQKCKHLVLQRCEAQGATVWSYYYDLKPCIDAIRSEGWNYLRERGHRGIFLDRNAFGKVFFQYLSFSCKLVIWHVLCGVWDRWLITALEVGRNALTGLGSICHKIYIRPHLCV